jgi:sugar lactone lactonase YvrE
MRVEQLTDAVAYHGAGPVWSSRWGDLRWVDMPAGDVLSLRPSVRGDAAEEASRAVEPALAAWRERRMPLEE